MATAIAIGRDAHREEQERAEAAQEMLKIVSGFWLSRSVQVAATLALPDLVADGPRPVDELAGETGTHAASLYRLLRGLASFGIFRELHGRRFAATAMSDVLRSDVPGSLRSAAISELGRMHYKSWGNLIDSVKTGEPAFHSTYGMDPWQFLAQNPELGATFNDSMTRLTEVVLKAVAEVYDFTAYKRIIDVGGGQGRLLSGILSAAPEAQGTLFDQPQVIEEARRLLADDPARERIEFAPGDFFECVPKGGDLYTMKWIIHDWADEESLRILRNIRSAMAPEGRLLLLEAVLPEQNEPGFGSLMDLNMLVMTGGRERREAEYRDLLQAAGLRLSNVYPTKSPISIVEALPE